MYLAEGLRKKYRKLKTALKGRLITPGGETVMHTLLHKIA
jgi:hypothetical protein